MTARIVVQVAMVAAAVGLAVAFSVLAVWVLVHDVPRKPNLYSPDETCTCTVDSNLRVRIVECGR